MLGGIGGAVFATVALGEVRRHDTSSAIATVTAGMVWILAAAVFAWVPWVDEQKGFAPFFADAGPRVPSGAPVFVLLPDEVANGVIPFYTGRLATPLRDGADLARAIEEEWRGLRVRGRQGPEHVALPADCAASSPPVVG
jgi:hypothetical protein